MRGYPSTPGYKDRTTSKETALYYRARLVSMKQRVIDLFGRGFVGTPDEVATALTISPFSARPRCTELLKEGIIERVKIDRTHPGKCAWILRLKAAP